MESPRPHKQWRRRSFPKRSVRRHSEKRDHDVKPVPDREPALPSPAYSESRSSGIEQEWCRLRQAQEQVRRDRQVLERDRAAHEAKVRYELEQLGRDIEEERRRLRQRRDSGGYYGFLPHSPPRSEEVVVDEEEEEDGHHDSWFGGYDYPPDDVYWGINGGLDAPDYNENGDDERSFADWASDDESEAFAQSAYRSYFQSPPRYNYGDFEESQQAWEEDVPSYREQPHNSRQKCEEIKKAYDAYIRKWKTLSATASSIPYPTINLTSALLFDHPEIDIDIDVPLSQDQTIELNCTLFFLLAFDLRPNTTFNSAGTPKIEMDPQAELEKVKALQKQMKVERIRWHPDSLVKRRVDGMVDEVESKGVYRALDELLEECKGRVNSA